MRIRFLSAVEPGWSFYRDLLPHLAEQGNEVRIVISNTEYRVGRAPLDVSLCHPQIKVNIIPEGNFNIVGRFQKAWTYVSYMTGAAIRTLLGSKTDLNFFLTQPPLFSIWGYALKVLRQQRYCILVMDMYPDVFVQAGFLQDQAIFTRILSRLSRLILRKADIVIAIGRCMEELLESEGVSPQRTYVIPNWANEMQAYPIALDNNQLRRELDLEDNFVVLYSGNIGVSHFFDDILEVAQRLQYIEDLRFVFIGNGVRRKEIEQAKHKNDLDNLMLLPFQPVERLAHSLSMGDVHFISLRSGFEGLVVPSKTYGALAAGRPVIYQGDASGEIARLVTEEQVGSVVPLENPDALEQTILHYYHNPTLTCEHGERAYTLSRGRLSRQSALEKYADVLAKSSLDIS